MISQKILRILLPTLLLMFTSIEVQAGNQGRHYTVEMIVFSYENDDPSLSEQWPKDLHLELPPYYNGLHKRSSFSRSKLDELAAELASGDTPVKSGKAPLSQKQILDLKKGVTADRFLLNKSQYILGNRKRRLAYRKDFRVLFHEAWKMPIYGKKHSVPIRIQGGKRYNGRYELDGSIRLSVARYLHVDTQLFLSKFQTATDQGSSSSKRVLSQVIPMKQSRRMRSKELHYIDHPKFGILIQFTPYQPAS